jgi:hypothetical protein
MTRAWKVALLLMVILLLGLTISLGWGAPQKTASSNLPVFTTEDRALIEEYYKELRGKYAPGSLDRTPFPLGIETALVRGSHVPVHLKKQLERLPQELESRLSTTKADFGRYRLGHHVVLASKADMTIGDILKNVVPK